MLCKFCYSKNTKPVRDVKSLINENSYTLYECCNCKSRFFNYNQFPIELKEMYNDLSDREIFPVDFKPSKKWEKQKRIVKTILKKHPTTILDVGCRTGDFLMHFKGESLVEGIELSADFAATATKRGIAVFNNFIENINFNKQYDVVTCYAILEHLLNPFSFLNKLQSIVCKGGLLVIMIPTHQSLKEKVHSAMLKKDWHMYSPPEHLNFFSREFLDSYFKSNGFRLKKRFYSSGGMTFTSNKKSFISKAEVISNSIIDNTILSKVPFFDHMYSYYILD